MSEEKVEELFDSLMYNITEDILVIMGDKNITKEELSLMIGVSNKTFKLVMEGEYGLNFEMLARICVALDVTPLVSIPSGRGSNE